MKKKHLLWLLCAMFLLGSVACSGDKSEDDTHAAASSNTYVTASAEGTTFTFNLNATGDWTAFASNNEPWITISPNKGDKHDSKLTIKVAPNDTGSAREGTVAITIGFSRQYITIQQPSK